MAAIIKKVKILLDENQEPFIPFTTSDAVFKDGTEETLTQFLDAYVAAKDEELDVLKKDTEDTVNGLVVDLNNKVESGFFTGPKGDTGATGATGATGNSGVYYGPVEPTDPNISLWVDTQDPVAIAIAERSDF